MIAGGVQTMTQIPISSAMLAGQALGFADPFSGSKGWQARFGDAPVSQFHAAQRIADHWKLSREAMEAYALASHQRAAAAIEGGRFAREIVPCAGVKHDETPRPDTTLARMAALEPLMPGSSLTAAVSSQTADAAAALLIVSEDALKRYQLKPRARIAHMSVMGDDPLWMLTAPIPATKRALERSGLRLADIDVVEINEAFASVAMAWLAESCYAAERTNPNGGAIALGHPLGATGARLMTTLLHELERTRGRYGLQTMCEGGGLANVTIIERL
ncbi:putative acyltransferase [compost metagenome]